MSTASTPPTPPGASTHATPAHPATPHKREITLISHSMLFYWWPIWVLGFTLAAVTYFEDHRLAVLPSDVTVAKASETDRAHFSTVGIIKGMETRSWNDAV